MFSRYKKPQVSEAIPARTLAAASAASPEHTAPNDTKPALPRTVSTKRAAQITPADKEKKRKERLAEIKLDMHRALLENLNLAALDHASEAELRDEISQITTEVLQEKGVVLNRDERRTMIADLYDEVKGLGPLEPLLKDDSISDILVNGPPPDFH